MEVEVRVRVFNEDGDIKRIFIKEWVKLIGYDLVKFFIKVRFIFFVMG